MESSRIMSRDVNYSPPSFISIGMVTTSSSPTSSTEVLGSSDPTGAIVVPSGGAYAWMGSPLAPVFFEAGTLLMSSLPTLSSSSSGAIAGGTSSFAAQVPVTFNVNPRSTEEEVTAEEAAEDDAADEAAWQEALAPPVPYTVPDHIRAAIMAQTPAPFVPSLSTFSYSREQQAEMEQQTRRFQQHVREQMAAQQQQQQTAEASCEQ